MTDYGNHAIRKVVIATGAVTTVAGSVGNAGTVSGVGTVARFQNSSEVWGNGTVLFVADGTSIRKIEVP